MILLEAGSAKMAFALIKCAIAQAVKPYGFEFALAIANKVGHPNGIRTRVTPVKGECPRPLDDRVVKWRGKKMTEALANSSQSDLFWVRVLIPRV